MAATFPHGVSLSLFPIRWISWGGTFPRRVRPRRRRRKRERRRRGMCGEANGELATAAQRCEYGSKGAAKYRSIGAEKGDDVGLPSGVGGGGKLPLYTRDEACVPEYLLENPYILSGYRAQYTTNMCLRSLFALHNETINVWTHGMGFILFVALSIMLFTDVLVSWEYVAHHIIYGFFCFGCLMCMACSTIYHLFVSHKNQRMSCIIQKMDYYGISTLMVASFIPPLYIGFSCKPFFRMLYVTIICVGGVLSLVMISLPFMQDAKHRLLRISIYVTIGFSGIVPFVHSIFILPHNSETLTPIGGIALMFILYGVGTLFYSLRIPECWYPGQFDILLSSHQIWHVFVLAAACVHFFTCTALYQQWMLSRGAC